MDKILIAFDVDGTLISDMTGSGPVVNERIRTLLVTLSSFKNVKIMVWSGGGELYARQVAHAIGIDKYVDYYDSKKITTENPNGVLEKQDTIPDIAIDDIQDCVLGTINLIVREK